MRRILPTISLNQQSRETKTDISLTERSLVIDGLLKIFLSKLKQVCKSHYPFFDEIQRNFCARSKAGSESTSANFEIDQIIRNYLSDKWDERVADNIVRIIPTFDIRVCTDYMGGFFF